ncbi:MAG: hypothetical protein K6E94_05380 [Elusimicrobiaceae bacterium]|nr:hypothetical protein [Elusimicrobiaceae bacterium]
MKKIIISLFCFMFFTPAIYAQNWHGVLSSIQSFDKSASILFQNYINETKNLITYPFKNKEISFTERTLKGKYLTYEGEPMIYIEIETDDIEVIYPKRESRETDVYNVVDIYVPKGYDLHKSFELYRKDNKYKLGFANISNNSIMFFKGDEDLFFKLDYEINLLNQDEMDDYYIGRKALDEDNMGDMYITIKYAPKYFTFKQVDNSYEQEKTVQVNYQGETINLETRIVPIFWISSPSGESIRYVLEPDYQNIYNDFKFVREGHEPEIIREIKNK